MEHDTHGDEAACLIVDERGRLTVEDVYNGFDEQTMELLHQEVRWHHLIRNFVSGARDDIQFIPVVVDAEKFSQLHPRTPAQHFGLFLCVQSSGF